MTTDVDADLLALRELADDILSASTEPMLDVQQIALPYDAALWSTLAGSGLTLLTTTEERGGTGAGLPELAVVLESAGFHAAPVPIAEHDLLASWLLGLAGLPVDHAALSAATVTAAAQHETFNCTATSAPWAADVDAIVVAGTDFVAVVPRDNASIDRHHDIAGQPMDRVTVALAPKHCHPVSAAPAAEFALRGAWARSWQTCGTLARALDLAGDHAREREQFGRPIARFQAVQSLLSEAAGSLSMAKTAAQFATAVVTAHGFDSAQGRFAVSVAKIESARAATIVARNVHQVHGAIGFTLDHRLRHFTTRALAWRSEFGAQRTWQHRLGQLVTNHPGSAWEAVTSLSSTVAADLNK
ncbi:MULTISPECIES: acyl-CoA dehydrogenase [unclassified Mycolicibacterium]|uniref:acyl-CoA dehydrogenase n=2 Tax=Mycolicibacterium TaxID=1866885 RepID=UPI001EE4C151|nr:MULTISPECIES: acyl-CoA dehydrogenase [unclassified Mycolicibacterium]